MKIKIILLVIVLLGLTFLLTFESGKGEDFSQQRNNMVKLQIKARGIQDEKVLEAINKVKRHLFVPVALRSFAYQDHPLPIGEGQTISQPYIVALMTELLSLKENEKVLEVGTGSGYQAAILAEISKEVYTIEILPGLIKKAEQLLAKLGYSNIKFKCGDGYLGWPEYAPFNAIIVTCAPSSIPPVLLEQLAEGGRLVIPVGDKLQKLKVVVKKDGRIKEKNIIPVRFVPMIKGNEKR